METAVTPIERTTDDGESLTTAVVSAIADARGLDVTELSTPLYDHVDPDALESIFRPRTDGTSRSGGRIIFEFEGCEVTIHSDRRIRVRLVQQNDQANRSSVTPD